MDMKQSLAIAVFVIVTIAMLVAILNVLMRERRQRVSYSGGGDTTGSFPDQGSDPSPFSGSHGGHHCSHGDSGGSDGGSCGGGDGGGGGGD